MLIESTVHLPISLAMFQDFFHHASSTEVVLRIVLRWAHFVAGITWIGLLYFFNLVNVPVQKALDPETKKKVNPDLLGRALWYFRWGAVVTVLGRSGLFRDVHRSRPTWIMRTHWRRQHQPLVRARRLANLSDSAVRRRVFAHQESAGIDQRWTRVRGSDVYSGRVHNLGTDEILRRHADRRWRELGQQQDLFDRHWRRLRHRHDAQRLGNHLAEQQANYRGHRRHRARPRLRN